jgi:hypothetical protein
MARPGKNGRRGLAITTRWNGSASRFLKEKQDVPPLIVWLQQAYEFFALAGMQKR